MCRTNQRRVHSAWDCLLEITCEVNSMRHNTNNQSPCLNDDAFQ